MSFRDLDEVLVQNPKRLPIGGRTFDFPDRVSAETGLLLLRIVQRGRTDPHADLSAVASDLLDETGWERVITEVLGRPMDEFIVEIGGRPDQGMHVFKTLLVWHVVGQDAAEKAWEAADPTVAAPANRAARRASTKKPAHSTAKGPSTRSAASRAGSSTNA